VTDGELTSCTAIFLGTEPRSTCPQCDCDADGSVGIGNLTTVSMHRLSGCPAVIEPEEDPGYAVNPSGTTAVANGALRCEGATDAPCLSLTVLDDSPTTVFNGDIWCQSDGECCVRIAGANRCWSTAP
jgi:hypothetical protein